MSAYTNHGNTSANRNSGRKSTLTRQFVVHCEGLLRKLTRLQQHGWHQNWIFILKTLFPQRQPNASFADPTSAVGLQLLNLWLLKAVLRCVNDGVTTIKPGHLTTGNARVIWSNESSFTHYHTSGKVYIWTTSKEAYDLECLVPTAITWWYSAGTIIILHGRTTARWYVDRLGI
jgi:hypothetical protein